MFEKERAKLIVTKYKLKEKKLDHPNESSEIFDCLEAGFSRFHMKCHFIKKFMIF